MRSTGAHLGLAIVLAVASFAASGWSMRADDGAAEYCTDNGGTVETRHPYSGTNLDQSQWVQLAGSIELCMFADPDDDNVRIYVDTTSLAARRPSLAAAAYLAKVPLGQTSPSA